MKFILIKENVQKARKILRSKGLDETNPSYEQIEKIVGDQRGFLGLFTYLFFIEEEPMYKLDPLLKMLKHNKKILHKFPMEIVNYKSIEKIYDDLSIILKWEKYNKEFVSKLSGVLKGEARKDTELEGWISSLDKKNEKDLFDNFLPKVSRYKNYSDFKADINRYLNKTDDRESILRSIEDHEDIYLVYNKDNIIISEVFSRKDSCEIGSTSWCISGNGGDYWDQYAGVTSNNKQYFLWNLNVASRDIDSQVGITINENGEQSTAHLKNDKYVNINDYCKKYNIPRDIFTPISKEDVPKLVKANEMDLGLAKKLHKMGVSSNYKHLMSVQVKMILGLLTEEEIEEYGSLDKYKEVLYHNEDDEFLNSLRYYLNNVDYTGDNNYADSIKENESYEIILHSFSFKDKLIYLEKYQGDFRSWEKRENILKFLDDDGLDNLFKEDIKSIKEEKGWDLRVEISNDTSDIDFVFENVEQEEFYEINELDEDLGPHISYLDDTEFLSEYDEEWEYIPYKFDKSVYNKLREYFTYIRESIFHPILLKEFDNIVKKLIGEDIYTLSDVTDVISNIDPRFTHNYNNSYFGDYMQNLYNNAMKLVTEDSNQWDKDRLGDFEQNYRNKSSSGEWTIGYKRILSSMELVLNENSEDDILPSNEHRNFNTLLEWLESNPGGLKGDYHFDDTPYPSIYYSLADSKESNKEFIISLQETIDGGNKEYEEISEENDIIKYYNKKLIKLGYDPISDKGNYPSDNDWFGYRSKPINLDKTIKIIDNETKEEVITPTNSVKVISLDEITSDGDSYIYTINQDISTHGNFKFSRLIYGNLCVSNHKDLIKIGVGIEKININEFDKDQYKLRLESRRIERFLQFSEKYIKL